MCVLACVNACDVLVMWWSGAATYVVRLLICGGVVRLLIRRRSLNLQGCVCVCMYVCMYVCMRVCVCARARAHMYTCDYVCMYMCMHMYTYLKEWANYLFA